jgi:hypothetical protein
VLAYWKKRGFLFSQKTRGLGSMITRSVVLNWIRFGVKWWQRKIKEDRGRRKSGLSKTHWRTYFGLCWEWQLATGNWQLATGKHKETNNDRIVEISGNFL